VQNAPLLFGIRGNSLDDGPGIRTVVFFKGCPLSCVWCHNPEGMRRGVEIAFESKKCVACDTCLKTCKKGALDRNLPFLVDRSRCNLCFDCVEECPSGALFRVGFAHEIDNIVHLVRRDLPFFQRSGGGVTLSGGEPTIFMEHASELCRRLKSLGVHVLLETCGLFELPRFEALLQPHLDLIYFDLKIMDPALHRQYCGADNARILDNFKALSSRARQGGVEILPRVPLVPGITDTESNLARIASLLREAGWGRVALLPYNPLWIEKLATLGETNFSLEGERFRRFMRPDELERCRGLFEGFSLV
jgi:pyruvate formate lyase activating enzyme